MTDRITDKVRGMTFVGNREVFTALKNQAQNPTNEDRIVLSMPPGGQQGVYATGIAQAIHEKGLTKGINTILASSAGAGSAYYLIAGADIDEGTRRTAEKAGEIFHTTNPNQGMVKVELGRPVLDLRTLAETFRDKYPIDPEVFLRSNTKLLISVASWTTGEEEWMDASRVKNPLSLVVASMLLPHISGMPSPTIKIHGKRYCDSLNPSVINKVLEQNPTHYLAIVPQPLDQKIPEIPGFNRGIELLVKAGLLPKICGRIPSLIEGLNESYLKLAEQAEATGEINGVKLAVIAPTSLISPLSMNKAELFAAQSNAKTFTSDLINAA